MFRIGCSRVLAVRIRLRSSDAVSSELISTQINNNIVAAYFHFAGTSEYASNKGIRGCFIATGGDSTSKCTSFSARAERHGGCPQSSFAA